MLVGGAVTGTVGASQGQGQGGVGYMSVSSYQKLVGDTPVDCVASGDGWDDTFFIRREAREDDDDPGVFIDVPPSCTGGGPAQTFRGYLITAEADTMCDGGPSDGGPQSDDCCSWLFVNENRNIRFGIEQRLTHVHGPTPPDPCHANVEPYDDDGGVHGNFGVVRVTFAPVPDGGRNGNGPP